METTKGKFKWGFGGLSLLFCLSLTVVTVAQAEPSPLSPAQERQQWQERLHWPAELETRFQHTRGSAWSSGLRIFELSPGWQLIEVQAYLGAYQPGQIYYLYDTQAHEGHLLQLPLVSLLQGQYHVYTQEELAGLAEFDSQTHRLSLYARYRGPGGCGYLATWSFSDEGVRLESLREQSCAAADAQGEQMILEPQRFPLIWPPSS